MYLPKFDFLGIGTQQGQQKLGLVNSARRALELIPSAWPIKSTTILTHRALAKTIHRSEQLVSIDWSVYLRAYQLIKTTYERGRLQLNWGGDHSVGLATVAAFKSFYPNGYVLWIDAHADLNTPESSTTGNFHGMPMSLLLGEKTRTSQVYSPLCDRLTPNKLIYFGLRDLDPFERQLIKSLGITAYFCNELNEESLPAITSEILAKIGDKPLHISFDIDSVDPSLAPSTGVKCANGLTFNQLTFIAQNININGNVKSVDIVEINPEIGSQSDVQKTYQIAFKFLEAIFNLNGGIVNVRNSQSNKNRVQISNEWNVQLWP